MSTNGEQPQGATGRFARPRNWFNNLSNGAKIAGGVLGTLATLVTLFLGITELIRFIEDRRDGQDGPGGQPASINADLSSPEWELNLPREAYLQEIDKPTKGKGSEELGERGVMVTADANIEGLQGKELTLTYTMYDIEGNRVPERSNKETKTIVPETDDDEFRPAVFVPYPPRAGEYYVRLALHDENGGQLSKVDTALYTSFYAGPQPPEDPITVFERLYDADIVQPLEQEGLRWIRDENGQLQMQVPSGWSDVDKRDWQLGQGGGIIGPALSASPNRTSFLNSWETPAAILSTSSWMMLDPPAWNYLDEYADFGGPGGPCEREGRYNYATEVFVGHYDVWKNCGPTDASIANLAAWPTGSTTLPPYMVVVTTYLSGEADIAPANAVLNSFGVLAVPSSQTVSPTSTGTATSDSGSESSTSTEAPNAVKQDGQDPTASGAQSNRPEEASGEKAVVAATVRGHYEAIGAGNFEEAYSYFGPTYRKQIGNNKQGWINSRRRDQITGSTINSLTVNKISENQASATVDVSFQDKSGTPRFDIVWSLVKEGGQWKLDRQLDAEEIR